MGKKHLLLSSLQVEEREAIAFEAKVFGGCRARLISQCGGAPALPRGSCQVIMRQAHAIPKQIGHAFDRSPHLCMILVISKGDVALVTDGHTIESLFAFWTGEAKDVRRIFIPKWKRYHRGSTDAENTIRDGNFKDTIQIHELCRRARGTKRSVCPFSGQLERCTSKLFLALNFLRYLLKCWGIFILPTRRLKNQELMRSKLTQQNKNLTTYLDIFMNSQYNDR